MFRIVLLCLSAASVARVSATEVAEQTLPAINVQYEFPASETLMSKSDLLDASAQDKAFHDRVRKVHEQLDRIGDVASQFAEQAVIDLDRLLAVAQLSLS